MIRLTERMFDDRTNRKAGTVLRAGYEAMLTFGPRRMSMQDIADRAGMSRPICDVLHFRNKDDIVRAVLAAYFAAAAAAVGEALAEAPTPEAALRAGFEAQLGDAGEAIMRSAHADALLSDANAAVAEGRACVAQAYARWIEAGVLSGEINAQAVAGNAARVASVMLAALDGLAPMRDDWPRYCAARADLARLFARALSA